MNHYQKIFQPIVLVVILSLTFFSSSSTNSISSQKENNWSQYKIKGKVRTIETNIYKAVERFGNIEKGDRCLNMLKYKYDGNKYIVFNRQGQELENYEYITSDGRLSSIDRYIYDYENKMIERTHHDSDSSQITKFTYKYDDRGNMIEENGYTSYGRQHVKHTYKYDGNGNKIEYNDYRTDGRLYKRKVYKYDNQSNKIEFVDYDSDGNVCRKDIYKYDDRGHKKEKKCYDSDGKVFFNSFYKCDDYGNIIEDVFYLFGELNYIITYKYDKNANIIEETRYNADGSLKEKSTYIYKFDNKENWVKKIIIFNNGIPAIVIEREIEYFE